jgi:hypothetical protein
MWVGDQRHAPADITLAKSPGTKGSTADKKKRKSLSPPVFDPGPANP